VARLFKSKLLWAAAVAAALVGLYALVGFKVAPGLVRDQAIKYVRQNYGRELRIGEVRLDPFKLQAEIRDLAFPDADGSTMLGFRRLFVDFELASLWQRTLTFKDVIVEVPEVRAVIRRDGAMNLADLAPKKAAPPEDSEESALPDVWLQSVAVKDGRVDFADLARTRPFKRKFSPVTFSLKDFRTTPEGGGFQLSASSEAGETFDWKGRFALAPKVSSQGELAIGGLQATGVAEYLGDALPFNLSSGVVNLAGTYALALGREFDVKLKLPKIELTGLGLRARGENDDWVSVSSVVLANTAVALPEQTVDLQSIVVSGLKAQAWMSPDGSINLVALFAPADASATTVEPAAADASAPPPATVTPEGGKTAAKGTGSGKPWQVRIASVDVASASIDFEDRMKEPAKQFAIAPLNVRVRNASLDLSQALPISVDAVINGHAPFKAEGTVTPAPLAAQLEVSLAKARMTILQPYVLPLADLTIKSGELGVKGKLRLDPPDAPGPDMSFDGDVTIDGFKSVDNALGKDLVNFRQVALGKLSVAMGPDAVNIDTIAVSEPFARVIISPERVINIAAVLDPKGTAATLEARRAQAAAEAKMTPADKRRRDKEIERVESKAAKARKASGEVSSPPVQAPLPAEGIPIRIREVRIDNGTMDFTDLFVQPNFAAEITRLSGTLTGLSSEPTAHAQVGLKGTVGEFSPVTISGEIQPFAFERYTDIDLRFENISLPIFNPYSGQLAGYSIAKGKLTTDLHYLIQDRKLDAQHKIRIDQLEWGEETAAKGEATLPVKFATALLKDRNGVIELDIPVTGSIDDPKFRIGPIVWQVIKNILVKAVTAPFALLGSLFEGAEDAQFVDFAPGSAALDPASAGRLAALSKSLVEKPAIKLDVPIGALAEVDGPALASRAYEQKLADAMTAVPAKGRKDGEPVPSFDSLGPDERIAVLTAVVKKQTGSEPQVPEPPAAPEGTSRGDAKAMNQAATIEYLEKAARAAVTVPDTELAALGEARAAAVEHALLDGSALEPTRVFLTKSGKVTAQDGKVRLELALQ
jgi:uncharacterized protein involved in outer membrane biogenesis